MIIFDYEIREYKGFLTPFTAVYMGAAKDSIDGMDVMIYDFYSHSFLLKDVPVKNLLSMFDNFKKAIERKECSEVTVKINDKAHCFIRYHEDEYVTLTFQKEQFEFYDESFSELKRDIDNAMEWLKQFSVKCKQSD